MIIVGVAAKRADDAETLLWQAVGTALDLDAPAAFIADAVNRSRATLYRRLGQREHDE